MSLTLLVAASLFIRTLRNLQNIDLGFQRENIAIFDIDPTSLGYRGQRLRTFYDQLLEHARGVPGVRSAALSAVTPMSNYLRSVMVSDEDPSPNSSRLRIRSARGTSPHWAFPSCSVATSGLRMSRR